MEKKEEEKEIKEKKDIIINNKSLKIQLRQVCNKIEEVIADYKERKLYGIPINNDNINKVDLQKFNEFVSKIEEQKNKTESYKEMIDYDNKYSKITKEENQLKYITKHLLDLKKEYEFLNKIYKKQEKGLNLLLNNNFNSDQIAELDKKLKDLKNEYAKLHNNYKSLNIKIKDQNTQINSLNSECSLIKDNIELKKKQKLNPQSIDLIENNSNINNEIKKLKNEISERKKTAKNQEESYKNELKIQIKKKKELEEEVKALEMKLLQYYQEKKINDLRMKEIKKINNELNKNKIREKNDLNLQKLKQQKENIRQINLGKYKILMENNMEKKFNFELKSFLLEDEKKNTKISNKSLRKPNLNFAKFNPNSKSSINIFNCNSSRMTKEEKRMKKEKEKEEFIKNLGKELEEHEKQRGKMIQEIEFLKDDIQKMLNKNEIIDKNINDIKKDRNEKNLNISNGNNKEIYNDNIEENNINENKISANIEENINNENNNLKIDEGTKENKEIKKNSNRNPFDFAFSNI